MVKLSESQLEAVLELAGFKGEQAWEFARLVFSEGAQIPSSPACFRYERGHCG